MPCPALCVYNPDRFRDTAKPESWPRDWPADPTTGNGFDRQRDFCTARRCACRDPASSEPVSEGGYYPPSQQGRGPVGLVLRACGAQIRKYVPVGFPDVERLPDHHLVRAIQQRTC